MVCASDLLRFTSTALDELLRLVALNALDYFLRQTRSGCLGPLVSVSRQAELAQGDVAGRLGGDEFVVLAMAQNDEKAMQRGERVIAAIAVTYSLGAALGASIGIAMAPEHGSNALDLLTAADAALYEAKSGGRSRCCVASPAASLAALRRLQVGTGARAADSAAA
jgi:predicted signal transduction protein with EAL and GGDEF domain